MFFILSKFLKFLFSPLTWVFGLFLFAIFSKNQKVKKISLISGVLLLYFFSNSFICDEFMRAWEIQATPYDSLGKYDAGIVLGGIMSYDPENERIQFFRSNDRLLQAIELYKRGIIRKIFFVGGSGHVSRPEEKEGTYVKRYLTDLGIPESDLLIENESRNTHENAEFAKKMIEDNFESGKFLLITSGVHMKRAMKCFEKSGVFPAPYSTDRYSGPRKFDPGHLLIPDVMVLVNWDVLIHEYIGFLTYKIAGYI